MSAPDASSPTVAIAGAIADAVGRQLSQFVSALAQQVDGAHRAIDTARGELRAEFAQQADAIRATFDQQAAALEVRVLELAAQQAAAAPAPAAPTVDPEELRAIRERLESVVAELSDRLDGTVRGLQQHVDDVERRAAETITRIDALAAQVEGTGDDSLDAVKEQLSSAVGEVMLVRIELDRIVAATDDKIGKATLRMAEIESLLADEMDVSTSVQLERLDELERAIAEIDPELGRRVHESVDAVTTGPAARPAAPTARPETGPTTDKARRLSSF